jgi:hypothetical protein
MLFAGDVEIDLTSVGERLTNLRTFLLEWIDQNTLLERGEGKTFIWKLRVKPPNQTVQRTGASRFAQKTDPASSAAGSPR